MFADSNSNVSGSKGTTCVEVVEEVPDLITVHGSLSVVVDESTKQIIRPSNAR